MTSPSVEWGYYRSQPHPKILAAMPLCLPSSQAYKGEYPRLGDNKDGQDYVVAVPGTILRIQWALRDTGEGVCVLRALGKRSGEWFESKEEKPKLAEPFGAHKPQEIWKNL